MAGAWARRPDGVGAVAADAVGEGAEGLRGVAAGCGEGAARGEVAARRRAAEVGEVAGDRGEGTGGGEVGEAGEEAAGVGVAGVAEEVGQGAVFDDAAGVEDRCAVAEAVDEAEIVADEEEGEAGLRAQGDEQVDDAGFDGDVERGGGFVEEEEVGVGGEGRRDDDALFHAAGELVGVGVEQGARAGEAGFGEFLEGGGAGLGAGEAEMQAERFGDLGADGERRVEGGGGVLEDGGDAAAAEGGGVEGSGRRR